jgi:hypothetical protein
MRLSLSAKHLAGFVAVVAALAAVPALSQSAPPDPEAARRAQEEQARRPNTPGDGPYPAILETDPRLPDHVIYRPADLSPFAGGRLPVVAWGNGACTDDGTAHRFHLAQIASYGYLVIAAGPWRSGPGATHARPAPAAGAAPPPRPQAGAGRSPPPPPTTAEDLKEALDWALAEDGRGGSKFNSLIARDALAVAGHSCGGLQALEIGADPRVKTVLVHNSGIFNTPAPGRGGMSLTKDALDKLHTPVIYLLGGPTDIAYANGTDDFARISRVPVVLANLPVGHGGTFSQPMGGAVAHVAVDWLEWQLRADQAAARTFVGENCRLCSGTDWTIQRKGIE